MIVECPRCEAKVDAKVVGEHACSDDDPIDFTCYLMECPNCHTTLLAGRYDTGDDDPPTRLWPKPEVYISLEIPEIIRNSMEEARVCFKAAAYNASTVMAGRALEGICRHFGTKKTYLGPGIRELHERGLIDSRLARWAGALQQARNLSAHASGERVSKQDAADLLAFLNAICEYVFVLTKKFEDYMRRRGQSTDVASTSSPQPADQGMDGEE